MKFIPFTDNDLLKAEIKKATQTKKFVAEKAKISKAHRNYNAR